MRTVIGRSAWVAVALVVGLAFLATGTVYGQEDRVSVERPGSILIFPKVINANGQDTVIQITNTSNMVAPVHCYYVDGQQVGGVPRCQVMDFELLLTRQQPTHWQVGAGRAVDATDSLGGIDPGLIPPTPPGFTGGLVCVALDAAQGIPMATNNLKGEATVGFSGGVNGFSIAKYNAIAIAGIDTNAAPTNELDLDYDFQATSPAGEYARCPDAIEFMIQADGGSDPMIDTWGASPSIVLNSVTVMPCNMDIESGFPSSATFDIEIVDEFETSLSGPATTISCWDNLLLEDVPNATIGFLGSPTGRVRLLPDVNGFGIVGVQGTARQDALGQVAIDANSVHQVFRTDADSPGQVVDSTIKIPN